MKLKEQLNNHTEQAWEGLHQRLQQDGLLDLETGTRKIGLHKSVVWALAAGVALLLMAGVSLFLLKNNVVPQTNMQVIHNDRGNPTLVTTLEDGSTVFLSDATSLEYPLHFDGDRREVVLTGDAFFEVARNEKQPFIIDTHSALIEVLGTSFNVSSKDESSFSLSVRTGEVQIASKLTGEKTRVKAGQTVMLYTDKLEKVQTTDWNQFQSYLNNIHFKDQTLETVLRIMNLRNADAVQITCTPEVAGKRLTTTFSNESPEALAEIISIGLNLHHSKKGDTICITHSE